MHLSSEGAAGGRCSAKSFPLGTCPAGRYTSEPQIGVSDLQAAVVTALESSSRGYETALRQAEARVEWLEENCPELREHARHHSCVGEGEALAVLAVTKTKRLDLCRTDKFGDLVLVAPTLA